MVLVASACSSSGDSAADPTVPDPEPVATTDESSSSTTSTTTNDDRDLVGDESSTTEAPVRTNACSTQPDVVLGTQSPTMESGGNSYTFQLSVSSKYEGEPLPLVIDLHPVGVGGARHSSVTQFSQLGEVEAFVVATPTGLGLDDDPRPGWEVTGVTAENRDDIGFIEELIAEVSHRVCIDDERIYLSGMGNGAFFAAEIMCVLGDKIAGVMLVAGVGLPSQCDTDAVPMIAFHGTSDQVVPIDGLTDAEAGDLPPESLLRRSSRDEFAAFAELLTCGEPTDATFSASVRVRVFSDCTDDVELRFYEVAETGHTWPGSAVSAEDDSLGATNVALDATTIAWNFFQSVN